MSVVEILTPSSSVDFSGSYSENLVLILDGRSKPAPAHSNDLLLDLGVHKSPKNVTAPHAREDRPFPSLPPLHRGYPDVLLREGVMRASVRSEALEPDAERAFFVADLSQVYAQHQRWKACLPRIEPFYAVKCNPDPYVLRLLAALGTGFDCASHAEISRVLSIGVAPSRIIFANPCKATSFVRSAANVGVDIMTFDNVDELYKVAQVHRGAKLVVRILTDDSKSLSRLGSKFGAPLDTVPRLLLKAKELGLDVIGVSFHVGSGSYDPNAFADAIWRARTVFDMGKRVGYNFHLLDVGGGFVDANFEATAANLSSAIDLHFHDRDDVRIIAEPGRFYVAKAFSLATNIIARRAPVVEDPATPHSIDTDSQQPNVMYYINDGVYGAFNCIMFDHATVHPKVLSLNGSFHVPASEPTSSSSVWGPTCDSIDCVCPMTQLPKALAVGDWLAFDNMGAYTLCAASQFNGFELSDVIYTSGGGYRAKEVRNILMNRSTRF